MTTDDIILNCFSAAFSVRFFRR